MCRESNSPCSMHNGYCHVFCLPNMWSSNLHGLNYSFLWVLAGKITLLTTDTVRFSVSPFSVIESVDTCLRYHQLDAPAWDFESGWWCKDAGLGDCLWCWSRVKSSSHYPCDVTWWCSLMPATYVLWFLCTFPDNSSVGLSIPWASMYPSSQCWLLLLATEDLD